MKWPRNFLLGRWRIKYETNLSKYCQNIVKNKFEVSKIYMTACTCLYKFYQIKKYFNYIQLYRFHNFFFHISYPRISWFFPVLSMIFQDFSRLFWFNSRSWMISYRSLFKNLNEIFMIFHVLSMILMNFSRFFQIFHV